MASITEGKSNGIQSWNEEAKAKMSPICAPYLAMGVERRAWKKDAHKEMVLHC
jgi:hypothetical protein